jgi:hypothetical protein
MKTTAKHRKRGLLLSLFCAGVVATFLGGCAESPYVTTYDNGYYYPSAYYTPTRYEYYPSSYYYRSSYYYPSRYYYGY